MSLADLGKRIWRVTSTQSKAFIHELRDDIKQGPSWENVKREARQHGRSLRDQLKQTLYDWADEETKRQGFSLHMLWGRDPEIERSYKLLQLPYGAPPVEVKHKWRDLLKDTHPDRFMHDPQKVKHATETTQRLTAAYHNIVKAHEEGRV